MRNYTVIVFIVVLYLMINVSMKKQLLTKSKYISGLQCHKYIWILMNEPDKIPKPDMGTRHKFAEGYLIDELAKKQYPSGIDIATDDFMKNIWDTQKYLTLRKPIFEAGFMKDNLFARADILNPVQNNKWDLIEIKSSTEVKDVHVFDVAFQLFFFHSIVVDTIFTIFFPFKRFSPQKHLMQIIKITIIQYKLRTK